MPRHLFIFFIIAFSHCSSVKNTSIIGEWKPTKVTFKDAGTNIETVVFDIHNKDKVLRNLFKKHLSQNFNDSILSQKDKDALWETFRKNYNIAYSAELTINKDSTFIMRSYGLIIPKITPGRHYGDIVAGNLNLKNNRLNLNTGDDKDPDYFFYKILKITNKVLIIGETIGLSEDPQLICEFIRK